MVWPVFQNLPKIVPEFSKLSPESVPGIVLRFSKLSPQPALSPELGAELTSAISVVQYLEFSSMVKMARTVHRVLSYLVFLQVSLWIIGGFAFAVLPFDAVIKGGAVTVPPPNPPFPGDWMQRVSPHQQEMGDLTGISAHNSSQGLLLELRGAQGTRWLRLNDGALASRPQPGEIAVFAASLYTGDGPLAATRHLPEPEYRYLGLVDELYGKSDVWQVSFDDFYGTRLYFDAGTGRYLTVRNNFWVFYDAMWRLHIMDFSTGKNFNNLLLRIFALLALIFTVSGLILTLSALRRALRAKAVKVT